MEDIEDVASRHRKEKKELQAHITALKKTAKNDKSKKKELTVEVARLETELENRHKQELSEVHGNVESGLAALTLSDDENIEKELNKVTKISKAQKRREKKSQQERERTEQIKAQEKENVNGPRNLETQSITVKLKEQSLRIFPIPSDGDCLYNAVSHQLQATGRTAVSVDKLRVDVANYIRENKDDFILFMSNPETYEMLTDEEFVEYCNKISSDKVWGGQLEIRALSNSLKCPIKVIQASGPGSIDQGTEFEGPPLVLTYHRHMYRLGEHYNSTEPIAADAEESEG